ncbi:hypothetical protein [Thiothrix subterranea]|uniref:Uncharacterized protein n=1 Tax=Thiothrix subterranea TaxID=2735563 RepID=A0ABU0Y710_9GAMM|nr:hypothetical protein [Thiothrix subterranea]MDQ5768567.1 hypothetical protein [Thiothrix subterranea]
MRTLLSLAASACILFISSFMAGCTDTAPVKEAETKSIQDVAKDAMSSTGKLTKEQVDALIRANAACRPDDKR